MGRSMAKPSLHLAGKERARPKQLNVEGRATGSAVVALNRATCTTSKEETLTAVKPARLARWACLGALVTALVGCSDSVTAWRKENSGGLYPAGDISGEPTFGVGWRRPLY
jgi:hypothetical protein